MVPPAKQPNGGDRRHAPVRPDHLVADRTQPQHSGSGNRPRRCSRKPCATISAAHGTRRNTAGHGSGTVVASQRAVPGPQNRHNRPAHRSRGRPIRSNFLPHYARFDPPAVASYMHAAVVCRKTATVAAAAVVRPRNRSSTPEAAIGGRPDNHACAPRRPVTRQQQNGAECLSHSARRPPFPPRARLFRNTSVVRARPGERCRVNATTNNGVSNMSVDVVASEIEAMPSQTATRLLVLSARNDRHIDDFILKPGKWTIGADAGCDLTIDAPGVAPRHVLLICTERRVLMKAWDPRTWLNEGPVTDATLRPGDRLVIGPIEFHVRLATDREILDTLPDVAAQSLPSHGTSARPSPTPPPERTSSRQTPSPPTEVAAGDSGSQSDGPTTSVSPEPTLRKASDHLGTGPAPHGVAPDDEAFFDETPPLRAPREAAAQRPNGAVPADSQAALHSTAADPAAESSARRLALYAAELEQRREELDRWQRRLAAERRSVMDALRRRSSANDRQQPRREAELKRREHELARREATLERRERDLQSRERTLQRQAFELEERQRATVETEQQLVQRERNLEQTKQTLQDLQSQLHRRQCELDELRRQLEHQAGRLQTQRAELQAERDAFEAAKAELEERRRAVVTQLQQIQRQFAELERENAQRAADLAELREIRRRLNERETRLRDLAERLAEQQRVLSQQHEQIGRREHQARQIQRAAERQQQAIEAEQRRLRSWAAQLQAREQRARQQYQHVAHLRARLEQDAQSLQRLRDRLEDDRERLAAERAELEHFREELEQQAATLRQQCADLQRTRRQTERRERELQQQHEQIHTERRRLAELAEELERRQATLHQLRQRLEQERRDLLQQATALTGERSELARRFYTLRQHRDRLRRERDELETARRALQEKQAALAAETAEVHEQRARLDRWHAELQRRHAGLVRRTREHQAQYDAREREWQRRAAQLQKRHEQLQKRQDELQQREHDLRRKTDELCRTEERLRERLARVEQREACCAESERQLAAREREWQNRARDLFQFAETLLQQRRQLEHTRQRLRTVQNELDAAGRALVERQQAVRRREIRLAERERRLDAEAARLTDWSASLTARARLLEQRDRELDARADELAMRLAELKHARKRLQQSTRDLESARETLHRDRQALQRRRDELSTHERQLDQRRAECETLRADLAEREEELRERERKLQQQTHQIECQRAELERERAAVQDRQRQLDGAGQALESRQHAPETQRAASGPHRTTSNDESPATPDSVSATEHEAEHHSRWDERRRELDQRARRLEEREAELAAWARRLDALEERLQRLQHEPARHTDAAAGARPPAPAAPASNACVEALPGQTSGPSAGTPSAIPEERSVETEPVETQRKEVRHASAHRKTDAVISEASRDPASTASATGRAVPHSLAAFVRHAEPTPRSRPASICDLVFDEEFDSPEDNLQLSAVIFGRDIANPPRAATATDVGLEHPTRGTWLAAFVSRPTGNGTEVPGERPPAPRSIGPQCLADLFPTPPDANRSAPTATAADTPASHSRVFEATPNRPSDEQTADALGDRTGDRRSRPTADRATTRTDDDAARENPAATDGRTDQPAAGSKDRVTDVRQTLAEMFGIPELLDQSSEPPSAAPDTAERHKTAPTVATPRSADGDGSDEAAAAPAPADSGQRLGSSLLNEIFRELEDGGTDRRSSSDDERSERTACDAPSESVLDADAETPPPVSPSMVFGRMVRSVAHESRRTAGRESTPKTIGETGEQSSTATDQPDGTDEPENAAGEPTDTATTDNPDNEQDDPIAAYMRQLLAKNRERTQRRETPEIAEDRTRTAASEPASPLSAARRSTARKRPSVSDEVLLAELDRLRRPQNKEAERQSIRSMRAVANQTARAALTRFSRKQARRRCLDRLLLSAAAAAIAGTLKWWPPAAAWPHSLTWCYAAAGVSLVMLLDACIAMARSVRPATVGALEVPQNTATTAPLRGNPPRTQRRAVTETGTAQSHDPADASQEPQSKVR
ncbi:MAG: hypothetical protein D6725_08105 [Planctomycetota bacterium]|nr:MAG: hypothetical protein D6725_08105 [Planctomycetota bacterium]